MNEILNLLKTNSSLIVSICAIGLTLQQSWTTRKHNKLSVLPRLTTFVERDLLPSQPGQRKIKLYKCTLTNSGLGPAFIEDFKFLIDGNPIEADEPDDVYKAIKNASKLKLVDDLWRISILKKEHVMGKDVPQLIAQLAFIEDDTELLEKDRYQVIVKYKSAYGESFTYDSRNHD